MTPYVCPNQVRPTDLNFLLCKCLMKPGVNYHSAQEAASAFCAYQHICSCTGRAENTENAVECFARHNEPTTDSKPVKTKKEGKTI